VETVQHAEIADLLVVQLPKDKNKRPYRRIPDKFCIICHHQMDKQNDWFCSINCYRRFRLGVDIDYQQISCKWHSSIIQNKITVDLAG
jgi:hypothetical protein